MWFHRHKKTIIKTKNQVVIIVLRRRYNITRCALLCAHLIASCNSLSDLPEQQPSYIVDVYFVSFAASSQSTLYQFILLAQLACYVSLLCESMCVGLYRFVYQLARWLASGTVRLHFVILQLAATASQLASYNIFMCGIANVCAAHKQFGHTKYTVNFIIAGNGFGFLDGLKQ